MRIIAGEKRGHRIAAPKGETTRPTSDRVREAAFNLIGPVDGAKTLDLFAGSGAMGMEALSRGAASCVFVEHDRGACRTIDANLEKLKLRGRLVPHDAIRFLGAESGMYDLILCDPPYDYAGVAKLAAHFARVLAPDGLLVYESQASFEPEIPDLNLRTSRRYGSARLTLWER